VFLSLSWTDLTHGKKSETLFGKEDNCFFGKRSFCTPAKCGILDGGALTVTEIFFDAKKIFLDIVTKQYFSCRKIFFLAQEFFPLCSEFFLQHIEKNFCSKKEKSCGKENEMFCLYIKKKILGIRNDSCGRLN